MQSPPVALLLGAILFGGVVGLALLMWGLVQTDGATASLLLNVEGVLTAVIAWLVFKEDADHIVLGMLAIVAGGVLLSWEPGGATFRPARCSSSVHVWPGPSTTI